MIDIRTVIILTVFYNYIIGMSLFIYGFLKKNPQHKSLALSLNLIGTGFLLLSLRDFIPQLMSVMLSNTLIIVGLMLLNRYLKYLILNAKDSHLKNLLILITFVSLFYYLTYIAPSINARIIIVSAVQAIYFLDILKTLITQQNQLIKDTSHMMSVLFILALVTQFIRIVLTYYEPPMDSFMSAGFFHSFSVILYQLMPFNLALGLFRMDNLNIRSQLETQAMTDGLTQLYNKVAFIKILTSELKRTIRYRDSLAIVMCDLDFFKSVNDTHGHQAGDFVLQTVSKLLQNQIRGNDLVGRYGGEEFILAIATINQVDLECLLEKLRLKIEQLDIIYEENTIKVTMSFGATFIKEDIDLSNAIKIADNALYDAKRAGRNRVNFL